MQRGMTEWRGAPAARGWAGLLIGLLILGGCGGGGTVDLEPADPGFIARLITEITGASFEPERFEQIFLEGSMPPDEEREKYQKFQFEYKDCEIDGNAATLTVIVKKPDPDGSEIGEVEWTAEKVGNTWFLKDTKLPVGG